VFFPSFYLYSWEWHIAVSSTVKLFVTNGSSPSVIYTRFMSKTEYCAGVSSNTYRVLTNGFLFPTIEVTSVGIGLAPEWHLILRLLKYTHYFLRRAIIPHIPQEFSTIDDGYSLTPRCDVGGLLRIIFRLYLYINIIHYFLHYVKRFVLYFVKVLGGIGLQSASACRSSFSPFSNLSARILLGTLWFTWLHRTHSNWYCDVN